MIKINNNRITYASPSIYYIAESEDGDKHLSIVLTIRAMTVGCRLDSKMKIYFLNYLESEEFQPRLDYISILKSTEDSFQC